MSLCVAFHIPNVFSSASLAMILQALMLSCDYQSTQVQDLRPDAHCEILFDMAFNNVDSMADHRKLERLIQAPFSLQILWLSRRRGVIVSSKQLFCLASNFCIV